MLDHWGICIVWPTFGVSMKVSYVGCGPLPGCQRQDCCMFKDGGFRTKPGPLASVTNHSQCCTLQAHPTSCLEESLQDLVRAHARCPRKTWGFSWIRFTVSWCWLVSSMLKLGGAFKYGFIFTPIVGELIQFDLRICSNGWNLNHQLSRKIPDESR